MPEKRTHSQIITAIVAISALIAGAIIGFIAAPLMAPVQTVTVTVKERVGPEDEIPIGALLPLSGTLSGVAENNKVAMEIAVEEVNKYLAEMGAPWKLKLYVEDTELNPTVTLEKLQTLHARGVKIVIGPMASSGVRNIKEYAESNGILVISQSSTAIELAMPGDNILRLSPCDIYQARVGPRYAKTKGITHVILFWRGDSWGDGLAKEAKKNYEKLGIEVVAEIRYDPEAREFSAEVATLADEVDGLISQGIPPEKIMIHLISFEEAVMIFLTATEYPNLAKTIWFGSDGTAMNPKIVGNMKAAEFATKVEFLNPIQAPIETGITAELASKIRKILGRDPDTYAYNSYDAVWLIALAILQSGSADPQTLKKVIPDVASKIWGASGPISFDKNGDRLSEYYTLTKIVKAGEDYKWVVVGKYYLRTDEITLE